eukprot:m51a1_g4476 hypothetical protein (1467) ;mRNA; r:254921-260357
MSPLRASAAPSPLGRPPAGAAEATEARIRVWLADVLRKPGYTDHGLKLDALLHDGSDLLLLVIRLGLTGPEASPKQRRHSRSLSMTGKPQPEEVLRFLHCCSVKAQLPDGDLFRPSDLVESRDMGAVIHTLDVLRAYAIKNGLPAGAGGVHAMPCVAGAGLGCVAAFAIEGLVSPVRRRSVAPSPAADMLAGSQSASRVGAKSVRSSSSSSVASRDVTTIDEDFRVRTEMRRSPEAEDACAQWIAEVMGEQKEGLFAEGFAETLKDGVVLCRLANALAPGSVARIYKGPVAFLLMQNIDNFIAFERALGMPSSAMFTVPDLFDGKSLLSVMQSIRMLAQLFQKRPSYKGPTMRDTSKSQSLFSQTLVKEGPAVEQENTEDPTSHDELLIVNWVNSKFATQGKDVTIHNLGKDVRTGVKLFKAVEAITGKTAPPYSEEPTATWQCMQNATRLLSFASQQLNSRITSCTPQDIVQGDAKRVASLLLTLREEYDLEFIFKQVFEADGVELSESAEDASEASSDVPSPSAMHSRNSSLETCDLSPRIVSPLARSHSFTLEPAQHSSGDRRSLQKAALGATSEGSQDLRAPALPEPQPEQKKESEAAVKSPPVVIPISPRLEEGKPAADAAAVAATVAASASSTPASPPPQPPATLKIPEPDPVAAGPVSPIKVPFAACADAACAKASAAAQATGSELASEAVSPVSCERRHKHRRHTHKSSADSATKSSAMASEAPAPTETQSEIVDVAPKCAESEAPAEREPEQKQQPQLPAPLPVVATEPLTKQMLQRHERARASTVFRHESRDSIHARPPRALVRDTRRVTRKPSLMRPSDDEDKYSEELSLMDFLMEEPPTPDEMVISLMEALKDSPSTSSRSESSDGSPAPPDAAKRKRPKPPLLRRKKSRKWRPGDPLSDDGKPLGHAGRLMQSESTPDLRIRSNSAGILDMMQRKALADSPERQGAGLRHLAASSMLDPEMPDTGRVSAVSPLLVLWPDLNQIMADQLLCADFRSFLMTEYAIETVQFLDITSAWLRRFRISGETSDARTDAARIFALYCEDSAPHEVNISWETKLALKKRLESQEPLTSTLWESARLEVIRLIRTDLHTRWVVGKEKGVLRPESKQAAAARASEAPPSGSKLEKAQQAVRLKALKSLLDTERAYVSALSAVCEELLEPLTACQWITTEELWSAFGNIYSILGHHKKFLTRVQERCVSWDSSQCIGDVFLEHGQFMIVYSLYMQNYPSALIDYHILKTTLPQFGQRVHMAEKMLQEGSIEGALALPMMRIAWYANLMKLLRKYTPKRHPDHVYTRRAFEWLSSLNAAIMRVVDEQGIEDARQQIRLAESICDAALCIVKQGRTLVHQGPVTAEIRTHTGERMTLKDGHMFLFTDLLVLCQTRDEHPQFKYVESVSPSDVNQPTLATAHRQLLVCLDERRGPGHWVLSGKSEKDTKRWAKELNAWGFAWFPKSP